MTKRNNKNPNVLRPRIKVWLETEEGYALGDGRMDLLRAVERLGSLNRAAAELGMSYRAAWGHVRTMRERLGFELLTPVRGGSTGGGSTLTPEAERLLNDFERFSKRMHALAEETHRGEETK